MKKEFIEFQQKTTKDVIKHFEKYESLPMTLMFKNGKGYNKKMAIPPFLSNVGPSKQAVAKSVSMLLGMVEANMAALVSEAWMVRTDGKEGLDLSVRPSEHENRVEVVMVNFSCKDTEEDDLITFEIIRDGDDSKPSLTPYVIETGIKERAGTLMNLFKS